MLTYNCLIEHKLIYNWGNMLKTFRKNWTPIVKQLTANICQKLWCKGGRRQSRRMKVVLQIPEHIACASLHIYVVLWIMNILI